ncbi:MAG: sulfatase, partial [Acidobacteria bacterium]
MNDDQCPHERLEMTRRHFFSRASSGIGVAALASLLDPELAAAAGDAEPKTGGLPGLPHFPPKARSVIFLHQSGGPAQMDLFDYKPKLAQLRGTELPDSVRMGQRITGMTSGQGTLPVAASMFKFRQHGESGAWVSDLLPHTA